MTREEAKEWLPIIQAWAEGKPIQYQINPGSWVIDINKDLYTSNPPSNYRVKPEANYRQFKSHEECWNEMMKHQPFGWIRNKVNRAMIHISFALGGYVMLATENRGFSDVFDKFEFIDGTPFGIKEE